MRNPLDAIVGWINPQAGLRRTVARQMLKRAHEGASTKDGWLPRRAGAAANTDHAMDAAMLRARSRALGQNVPFVAAAERALVAQTVGTGIIPKWRNASLERAWKQWGRFADADGRLDVYGLQAAAYRAMERDGEVLIRERIRRLDDGLPVPIQFQLLEIDWLDSSKSGRNGANVIVNGIEYDPLGRPVYYWLFESHPGEQLVTARGVTSRPVPAPQIIHLYAPERPGQGRGFPRIAPGIARVRDLQLYEDAELHRKNLETRLAVLASGDVSAMSSTTLAGATAKQTGELGELPSGGVMQVPDGVHLTTIQPNAAPGYTDYIKLQLHIFATGYGVPYEMVTGDMSQVNFSSARIRALDFRREVEMTQWLTLVPRLCEPIADRWARAAELGGIIASGADTSRDWSTPKWDYTNPQQEVSADLAEIGGGLSSLSEKLRRRGYDPDDVLRELKEDIDKLREYGLLDLLPAFRKSRR